MTRLYREAWEYCLEPQSITGHLSNPHSDTTSHMPSWTPSCNILRCSKVFKKFSYHILGLVKEKRDVEPLELHHSTKIPSRVSVTDSNVWSEAVESHSSLASSTLYTPGYMRIRGTLQGLFHMWRWLDESRWWCGSTARYVSRKYVF